MNAAAQWGHVLPTLAPFAGILGLLLAAVAVAKFAEYRHRGGPEARRRAAEIIADREWAERKVRREEFVQQARARRERERLEQAVADERNAREFDAWRDGLSAEALAEFEAC